MGSPPEHSPHSPPARSRAVPPLLPWQPCLIAGVAGVLAATYPLAGLCGLGLLALFPRPAPGRPPLWTYALAFGLGLGAGAWTLPQPPRETPSCLAVRHPLDVVGRTTAVEARPDGRLAVTLDDATVTGEPCRTMPFPGRLALTIDHPAFRPVHGDVLAVTARLRPTGGFVNPGAPDFAFTRRLENVFYRAYARGDKGQVRRLAQSRDRPARWRERLRQQTAAALAPPSATDAAARAGRAMVLALLFGDRSGLTLADVDLVRRASLAHTLALSGMHVGFVAALGLTLAAGLVRLFPRLCLHLPRQHLGVLMAGPLVAIYCWLGGATPTLLRAALMFAAFGLMLALRRDKALLDGLFLAIGLIVLVSPRTAYDVRLQLSALAVAGIAALWPLARRLGGRLSLPRPVRGPVAWAGGILWASLCAEAAVWPLIGRLYGDITPSAWVNVVWLPVLGGLAMPLALAGLAVLSVPGGAVLGGWLLTGAARCCEGLMRLLTVLANHGALPVMAVLRPDWPEALGCLGLLAGLAIVLAGGRRPTAALLASLALLVGPGLVRAVGDMRDTVSLTVLDVGQGQSVVVALPGGRRLVVDAGGLFGDFDIGRAVVGAYLTDGRPPRIDAAFASHPHTDHVKGFVSLLDRMHVGAFYDNGGTPEGSLATPIARDLEKNHIPHAALVAGDDFALGDGYVLSVLHPGPDDDRSGNNGSLILRLTRNGRGLAVIPGDAERGVLSRLAASGAQLSADVLVLPHHGSISSFSRHFLTAVSPKVAIASCGDTWAFPSTKLAAFLARQGCRVLSTNRDGAVTVRLAPAGGRPAVTTQVAPRDAPEGDTPFAIRPAAR